MEAVSVAQLAETIGGRLLGEDMPVSGATIDSRRVVPGELFVALRGSRVDGHDFVVGAGEAGAAAAMVERPVDASLPQWLVADTRQALAGLGDFARKRSAARLVAVTGSNGKTTVKEMIAAILACEGETLATVGNLNNELGVPLTLCRLEPRHRFGVLELGASGSGEIAALTEWVRPEVGIVTNAGPAHLEGFGSLEGVARGKGELFQRLPPGGCAVVNGDDRFAPLWMELAGRRRVLRFGLTDTDADVRGRPLADGRLLVELPGADPLPVALPLPGAHNRRNALGAAAVAHAFGMPPAAIREGLEGLGSIAGRLRVLDGVNGSRLLDDSYNANPASLEAGLEVLAEEGGSRWLALGDMAELGPEARALHREAGRAARRHGVERLLAYGALAAEAATAFGEGAEVFSDRQALTATLRSALRPDVCLLVKGSRSAAMDGVVRALIDDDRHTGPGD